LHCFKQSSLTKFLIRFKFIEGKLLWMFSTKRASLSAKHFLVGVHCAHCSIRACRILFQIITKYMVMLSECMTSILLNALKLGKTGY